MPLQTLTIATRKSRLAMWQAEHVATRLRQLHPHLEVRLLPMSTRGDEVLDRSLAAIGGKGLFIKELEHVLLSGAADLAVHSLKDVPMELEPEFQLTTILQRESPFDALVSPRYAHLDDLPAGALVGTSSLRRQAVLTTFWPQLKVVNLRGNLDTRLAKLDGGEFDAIILAESGLRRLGYHARIQCALPLSPFLPAVGQGALALEIATDRPEVLPFIAPLNHANTHAAVHAERAVARALAGSCQTPLGVYAHFPTSTTFSLQVQILGRQGEVLRLEEIAEATQEALVVERVLAELARRDAPSLLAQWQA